VRIAIGADHRGYPLKERLKKTLEARGHEVIDEGCASTESVDYPDFAFPVGERVAGGGAERGILVCASGIGMSIAANKVRGVRAALCRTVDDARMTREHNDSNVLTLSERGIDDPDLDRLVAVWLETPFAGERHKRRIDKILAYERSRGADPGDYVSC
jgi:ribose 5-phosphate isomerase B